MSLVDIDISVIIVNYNVRDAAENCISSIYKSNNGKFNIEILFVDNHSLDGSVERISKAFPDVKIYANSRNLGFSKANNIALKDAKGKYILILNPDTVLEEGTFEKMISFCENHPDVGAVSSKLILADGKLDLACRRTFPSLSVALPRILGLSRLFPKSRIFGKYNLTYLDENQTVEVDAICGAFMFIPANVLKLTGYFDEDYFMYGEDLDLCYKIKKNNLKVFYYPEVTTIHLKGESTKKSNISYVNNFYGAMMIFVRKNLTESPKILILLLQIGIFYRSLFSYLKRILRIVYPAVIDATLIFFSLIISVILRFNMFPNKQYLLVMSGYVFVWIMIMLLFGNYLKKNLFSVKRTFTAVLSGFFINSSLTYFLKDIAYSREVIISATAFSILLLVFWRSVVNIRNFFVNRNITLKKINLLIVGEKPLDQNLEERINSRFNIIHINPYETKYTIDDIAEIINLRSIREVMFSGDAFSNQDILKLMWKFKTKNVSFKLVPQGKELIFSRLYSGMSSLSLIEIEYNINNKLNIFFKRVFDVILSALLIVFVFPFLFIYKKFSGKELSKHAQKLMMLPGVFVGKYSFVGMPVWYDNSDSEYFGKKGLTGLVQLYHYDGISDEEITNYNIYYAKNQTLMLDIEILLKTLFSFLKT